MTALTDEEIEREAERFSRRDGDGATYVAFIAGANWAREHCGLQWKRPEEEMPEDGESGIIVFTDRRMLMNIFWISDARCRGYWEGSLMRKLHWCDVLAWARIELPEWVEGRE